MKRKLCFLVLLLIVLCFSSCKSKPKICTVKFNSPNGSIITEKEINSENSIHAISIKSTKEYTVLGWDTEKGKTSSPLYYVGAEIKVHNNMELYPVLYSSEITIDEDELMEIRSSSDYDRIIIVGDSRTVQLEESLLVSSRPELADNISFIALNGSGFDWMKAEAWPRLEEAITKDGRKAVILTHGANDLGNIDEYISFYIEEMEQLKENNSKLYVMSVNPFNSALLDNGHFYEPDVLSFNEKMKTELCENYDFTYLDCYSFLCDEGYSFFDGDKLSWYKELDGLHYSYSTYLKIYSFIIDNIM